MNTYSIKMWVIFDIFIYLILSREICERKKLISGQQPIWKLKNETCKVLCCVETSAKVDSWIWLVQFCAGRSSQDILLTLHTLRETVLVNIQRCMILSNTDARSSWFVFILLHFANSDGYREYRLTFSIYGTIRSTICLSFFRMKKMTFRMIAFYN